MVGLALVETCCSTKDPELISGQFGSLAKIEIEALEENMAVTRTTNIYNPAVIVDVSHHDNLLYRVTVRGATPGRFTLIDGLTKKLIWSSNDAPTETTRALVYERQWPRPIDSVSTQTSHTMGFQFLGIREVKYEVELHHKLGSPKKIFDIDYKATDDADSYFEDLDVTTF
jgi:hypothetical protein